ncbi:MFS transporter [Teichococcus aestuarii]|uniref:MFS transporter n=1 Tax=Teichococcus aestuarii TaxID=568898 RepID=UPI00361D1D41
MGSLGLVRRDSRLRSLTCAAACFGVSQFCFAAFFVAWQVEVLGTPLTEAGLRMALAQGAGVAGRVFWGLLADRVGPVPVLVAIGAGAVLGCVALAFAGPARPGLAVTLAGMVLGATGIGWNGVLLGEVARIAPQGRVGGATAALGVVFGVVQVVMPVAFTALVAGTGSYLGGFLLCAACALAGAFWVRGGR